MFTLPAPAPIKLMFFPDHPTLDQVALPALTLMVSPLAALFMQVCTLLWSGVLVHVGLDPVHEAAANKGHRKTLTARTNHAARGDFILIIRLILRLWRAKLAPAGKL